jgi:hypothetical protein
MFARASDAILTIQWWTEVPTETSKFCQLLVTSKLPKYCICIEWALHSKERLAQQRNASSQSILQQSHCFKTWRRVTCSFCDLKGAPRVDRAFEKLKNVLLARLMKNANMMLSNAESASAKRKLSSRVTNPPTYSQLLDKMTLLMPSFKCV